MGKGLNLVFVYIGERIPAYVIKNVNRTANLFDFETHLFVSEGVNYEISRQISKKVKISHLVNADTLSKFNLAHDFDFRNGFWFYTLERLVALKQAHESIGSSKAILHIEADMLMMPSFPFENYLGAKLKWFKHDKDNDVASLVYSPTLEQTIWLHDELLNLAKSDPYLTDMSALFKIRRKYPSEVETFPDLFDFSINKSEAEIFDGAALGQWLIGLDPRNTYGFTFLHENNDFVSSQGIKLGEALESIKFKLLTQENLILEDKGQVAHIHCLHVHSKELCLFDINNSSSILKYVNASRIRRIMADSFDWNLCLKLIKQNFRAKSLRNYILNLVKFLTKRDSKSNFRIYVVMRFFLLSKLMRIK